MYSFELQAYDKGYKRIIGVDEVGRGPYAGPVVAAAVILPKKAQLLFPDLNDSKKLSAKLREKINEQLHSNQEVKIAIVEISPEVIDEINILKATHLAMRMAVEKVQEEGDYILVDGNPVMGFTLPSQNIIKGDSKSGSIAAASIVAKVYRDELMKNYDKIYPGYNFSKNSGYGTKSHQEALNNLGPCPIHRKSFAPIAKLLYQGPVQQNLF